MIKPTLKDRAETAFRKHREVFENWPEGNIKEFWEEEGVLCIRYESGKWYHYKKEGRELTWW